ncbi:hypothetical protein M433DRAFT_436766 [Acidomyces richmondensis BFW]|nr:hypothetical protein M433DRAFT_436766 [Acidomyces richmondensis BFW]
MYKIRVFTRRKIIALKCSQCSQISMLEQETAYLLRLRFLTPFTWSMNDNTNYFLSSVLP